jgi:hypothetical protein
MREGTSLSHPSVPHNTFLAIPFPCLIVASVTIAENGTVLPKWQLEGFQCKNKECTGNGCG